MDKSGKAIDPVTRAADWLASDPHVAMATVVETWGSAPVPVGGQMAVRAGGAFAGSVSGGCVEGDILAEAEDIIATGKAKTLAFGVADETAWRAGLPCGGKIRVHVERLSGAEGRALLERAGAADTARRGVVIATPLGGGPRQVYEEGATTPPELAEPVAAAFRTGRSRLVTTPGGEIFLAAHVPAARLVIVGATHIAQLLAQMAGLLDLETIVVDPRTAFASPERFPAVALVAEWPTDALPRIGLDRHTAVVTLAHEGRIDDEALIAALKAGVPYVGALGSRRTHGKRVERLAAVGLTTEQIARIRAPIGLDIGADSPAEIALSVAAEVIKTLRERS